MSSTSSSNVSWKGKEKVDDASRMPSLSASHDNGDSSGSEQSLDDEFGISSVKTPGARIMQAENRPFKSDTGPYKFGRVRNPI